jgi:hypothetical protein
MELLIRKNQFLQNPQKIRLIAMSLSSKKETSNEARVRLSLALVKKLTFRMACGRFLLPKANRLEFLDG